MSGAPVAARALERLARRLGGVGSRLRSVGQRITLTTYVSLRHRSRPDDLFLVTYPKSGTTILQVMVHVLRGGSLDDCEHIGERVLWFEIAATRRPDLLESQPSPRCFKSHLLPYRLPRAARVIYLVRDVEDVALSYFKYRTGALGTNETLDEFVDRFARGKIPWGSWAEHVAAWARHRDEPRVLWLEFGELVRDRRGHAERIADFAGFDLGDQRESRIAAAVEATSLDTMRRQWQKLDPRLHAPGRRPGFCFVGEGRVGSGREVLSSAARARLAVEAGRASR
ncbi:MAG: sulfotransferase domain-containing protein [Polyangiaceae bacterium]|nr:sulfotransferase domain-containing protein [Polyangiaceae bacterium]